MKKHLLITALLTILSFSLYSQIVFENGYFINESNQKVNCLIKNVDWRDSPTEFEYKISQNEPVQKASIQTIKEFGINGISKYIGANVNIDRSGGDLINMNSQKNPIFQEERLFLKVLIDGKASLYNYSDKNLTRFFYKMNDSAIIQLVYKRYLNYENNIAQNNTFRQQLYNGLKCEGITSKNIESIRYIKNDLMKLFVNYNECMGSDNLNYKASHKKALFNLSLRPGLNQSSLAISNPEADYMNTDFGNKFGFRFGIEGEYLLPFNKNKWGFIMEPTFQYFKSEKTKNANGVSGGVLVSKVNYQSIELPFGVRYYIFLNDESKIYINASYVIDFSYSSNIEHSRSDGSVLSKLDIETGGNIALGVGYKYKDKYSVEMRYQTSREILHQYAAWSSDYKTISVIFGYSLFK